MVVVLLAICVNDKFSVSEVATYLWKFGPKITLNLIYITIILL